jgi:hypothetical protein
MRFLAVDKRQASAAGELLREAGVADVELVVFGNGKHIDAKTLSTRTGEAHALLVGVYERIVRDSGWVIDHSVATVLGARTTILSWLCPEVAFVAVAPMAASAAFIAASEAQPTLLLAKHALDNAHDLPDDRLGFANRAATALQELARTGEAKPCIDAYFKERGLDLARSGNTTYAIEIVQGGHVIARGTTQWHLSQGKRTTKAHASRIYFFKFVLLARAYVLVLHVGPHPDQDVTISVTHELPP